MNFYASSDCRVSPTIFIYSNKAAKSEGFPTFDISEISAAFCRKLHLDLN